MGGGNGLIVRSMITFWSNSGMMSLVAKRKYYFHLFVSTKDVNSTQRYIII